MHTMALRVGIDLVSVEAVRESVSSHGEHYLARVYDPSGAAAKLAADAGSRRSR
jgi:phosphopantetheinyl transferase (holo-ACP synthase)